MVNNNQLQVFKSEFGEVRTITINNAPYFVGKDIADILKYQNGSRDINRHVDEEDRCKIMLFDGSQNKETIAINESGLYSLLLSSKLPQAKKFKRWVTSEVLPTIRQKGGYIKADEQESPESIMAKALMLAKETIEKSQAKIESLSQTITDNAPKVLFADAMSCSKQNISIGAFAKVLYQNGCNIGQNRLFRWLRENNYLCRVGCQYNLPTQYATQMGLFEVETRVIQSANDKSIVANTTKLTPKGQQYFINKFLSK